MKDKPRPLKRTPVQAQRPALAPPLPHAAFPGVWWRGPQERARSLTSALRLSPADQPRALGRYLTAQGADHTEVTLDWHAGGDRVMVTSYAETQGRSTGTRFSVHADLNAAVTEACAEVERLEAWRAAGGNGHLTPPTGTDCLPLPVVRSAAILRAEETRLLAQQARLQAQCGTGSKGGIAGRCARRDRIGDRLYHVRNELSGGSR